MKRGLQAVRSTGGKVAKFLFPRGVEARRDLLAETPTSETPVELHSLAYFQQRLEEEFRRAQRYGNALAVLIIEVDEVAALGGIDLSYAGSTSEDVARHLADVLRSKLRSADLAARLDERGFGVLLAETGAEEAQMIAQRIGALTLGCDPFAPSVLPFDGPSLSYGLAAYGVETQSGVALLKEAETSLQAMRAEKSRRAHHRRM